MSSPPKPAGPSPVTRLLRAWGDGDEHALEELMEHVYGDLRNIARNHLRRERHGHTLEPTALVNELYVKLVQQDRVEWRNRQQFYAIASRIMRRLLIDYARERQAGKRRRIQVTLKDDAAITDGAEAVDVVALDAALSRLQDSYPRESQVVELRYFGGLTHEEVAAQLGVSVITVKRDWRFAKSWLLRAIEQGQEPARPGA